MSNRLLLIGIVAAEQINPHIYVVSRRLKDALDEHELTGMRLVPVIDSGTWFSEADLALDAASPALESRASRFQLIVTATPEAPPRIGNVSIRRRCEACRTVYLYLGGGTPYFEQGTLVPMDFQAYRSYRSDNEDTFDIAGDACIVSARFLKLMNELRFTGLADYSKRPKTPYGVVLEK